MIIAITAEGSAATDKVCPRFGRAPVLVVVDTARATMVAIDNSEGVAATSGAGTRAVQLLCDHKVTRLYTGQVGPKARTALDEAKIEVVEQTEGTLAEVLQQLVVQAAPAGETDMPELRFPLADAHQRIAVPVEGGTDLSAARSGHFGRCAGWVLVDIANATVAQTHYLHNDGHVAGGCLAPVRLLAAQKVNALVVAGIGATPYQGFRQAGIDVFTGDGSTVNEVVQRYLAGQLCPLAADQLCGHHA